ncbi:MAG: hypothetical protein RBS43_03235, partial [Candidatus Cloacimonas sp.]|nr:hypothetical protein [Candidatus Cloacimonas sp.]
MSWLYGFHHKHVLELPVLHTEPVMHEFHQPGWDVFAGGREDVCYWLDLTKSRWLCVLGMPVMLSGNAYRYLVAEDWPFLLAAPERLRTLDGHFVLLHFDGKNLNCYNDALGKRSLYFVETRS